MAKKKKKSPAKISLIILSVLVLSTALVYFLNRPRFIRYPEFGIAIPSGYAIHGIDVSHHQATIDWQAVKDMQDKNIKIGFAFIKATEGLSNTDNAYRRNWFKAKEQHISRGAYHFFIASKSGKAQAQNFIETVALEKGDMPPVLDIEQTNGASTEDITNVPAGTYSVQVTDANGCSTTSAITVASPPIPNASIVS